MARVVVAPQGNNETIMEKLIEGTSKDCGSSLFDCRDDDEAATDSFFKQLVERHKDKTFHRDRRLNKLP